MESLAIMVTIEAVETNQLQSRNKHQWEMEFQCDNEYALTPLEYILQQYEAKLNELISQSSVLKNRNCVLETNLEDMTWQQNNWLSERHLLETQLRTLQEECYEYRAIAEDALLKNSALNASNEKEIKEVEARLERSEANVARWKDNFQQLRVALTAERMRTAIHGKEKQNAHQALAFRDVEIRRLETNLEDITCQKNNLLSDRHLMETEVKTLLKECYEYTVIAEDALLKNSELQAIYEKEIGELKTKLELRETNAARCKANFQATLTTEHMRSAIHAKEEENTRQALALCNDENRRFKAANILQQIGIAELEAEVVTKCKKQDCIIPKPVVKPKKRDSTLQRFKTKICTSKKPTLNRLGEISPSKMSNWFASPVRTFPIK